MVDGKLDLEEEKEKQLNQMAKEMRNGVLRVVSYIQINTVQIHFNNAVFFNKGCK